jgi:hypothetical protein
MPVRRSHDNGLHRPEQSQKDMRHCLMTRQNQTQQLNAVVDNALFATTDGNHEQLRLLAKAGDPGPLAERIRRRATLLAR